MHTQNIKLDLKCKNTSGLARVVTHPPPFRQAFLPCFNQRNTLSKKIAFALQAIWKSIMIWEYCVMRALNVYLWNKIHIPVYNTGQEKNNIKHQIKNIYSQNRKKNQRHKNNWTILDFNYESCCLILVNC